MDSVMLCPVRHSPPRPSGNPCPCFTRVARVELVARFPTLVWYPTLCPGMSVFDCDAITGTPSRISLPPNLRISVSLYPIFYLKRPRAGFVRRDLLTEIPSPPFPPTNLGTFSSSVYFPKASHILWIHKQITRTIVITPLVFLYYVD